MPKPRLRIVTTNDFYGSYFPRVTSYGMLPGGQALMATVDRLRDEAPTLWIDCGDFAQGGPLAPASGGVLGFVAVRDLGIDAGTIGNHEFDWGEPHLRKWLAETGYPIACANSGLDVRPSLVLQAGELSVGMIGLTHPELARFHPDQGNSSRDWAVTVRDEAASLRREGVDWVVLALHDGVDYDWTVDGRPKPRPARLEGWLISLADVVDAVLGGHTLARWAAALAGIPYVQPWAFGAEVGVIDLFPDGRADVATVAVTGAAGWDLIGAGLNGELARNSVGELAAPLVNAPTKNRSLPAAVAEGMVRMTGADVALVSPAEFQTMQPPIDGVFAFLPAGGVTEVDILRVIPWLDDSIDIADMTANEAALVATLLSEPESWAGFGAPESAGAMNGRSGSVALSRWNAKRVSSRLEREISWTTAGSQRDALRAFVSR